MIAPAPIRVSEIPAPAKAAADLAAELSQKLPGRVSLQEQDRLSYARDMWPQGLLWIRQGRTPPPPDVVVWPKTEEELIEIIRLARQRKVPVIPFGAGSGVCGGVWAIEGGIAVDLKRLEKIGTVDPDRLTVEIQAGAMGEVLERNLNAQGYTLGHFPSSIWMSTLGGWLAARSAGQFSNKYGKIEDMALSVRAVTGRGELLVTPERPFRGPDLAQVLIGSEGTLCTFTGAKLRVHPYPAHRTFRGIKFRTVEQGVEAIRLIFRAGLRPSVVRLYDPFDTAIVGKGKPSKGRTAPSLRTPFRREGLPGLLRRISPGTLGHPKLMNRAADLFQQCLLILLFEGEAERAIHEDEYALELCLRSGGVDQGEDPGRHWYQKRYDVSYKMSPVLDANAFADTMEVACTWDRVLPVYEAVRAAVAPLAFCLCHFSHAYLEGCSLYFSFVSSGGTEVDQEVRYRELWRTALAAASGAGANISHHHGLGLLKSRALIESLGEAKRLLPALKQAFDPDGIMNPGKLQP